MISLLSSLETISQFFLNSTDKISVLFPPTGTEFTNWQVTEFLEGENIKIVHPNSDKKACIVERANRSLQGLIFKYMTERQTYRYVDVLPELVKTYNKRGHRTLKFISPEQAEKEENQQFVFNAHNERFGKIVAKRKEPTHKVGEMVFVKKLPTRMDRGYHEGWRNEYFKIVDINKRMPVPMYLLKSMDDGKNIAGGFYSEEISKIRGNIYKISEVLKERVYRRKHQLFVSWVGFGDKHNCWIDADSVTDDYRAPRPDIEQ
jgi:hypothetical protein